MFTRLCSNAATRFAWKGHTGAWGRLRLEGDRGDKVQLVFCLGAGRPPGVRCEVSPVDELHGTPAPRHHGDRFQFQGLALPSARGGTAPAPQRAQQPLGAVLLSRGTCCPAGRPVQPRIFPLELPGAPLAPGSFRLFAGPEGGVPGPCR